MGWGQSHNQHNMLILKGIVIASLIVDTSFDTSFLLAALQKRRIVAATLQPAVYSTRSLPARLPALGTAKESLPRLWQRRRPRAPVQRLWQRRRPRAPVQRLCARPAAPVARRALRPPCAHSGALCAASAAVASPSPSCPPCRRWCGSCAATHTAAPHSTPHPRDTWAHGLMGRKRARAPKRRSIHLESSPPPCTAGSVCSTTMRGAAAPSAAPVTALSVRSRHKSGLRFFNQKICAVTSGGNVLR